MFHLPGHVLFIHIPRTGGTSIEAALQAAFPAGKIDSAWKHIAAWDLRWTMPIAEWERCYKFAVDRDPFEAIASSWRFAHQQAAVLAPVALPENPIWCDVMRRAVRYSRFADYVRHEWLGECSLLRPGGFVRTWCLGLSGESLGVEVLQFDGLAEGWARVCAAIGLDPPAPLPHLNAAPTQAAEEWPDRERAAVAELCWMDLVGRREAQACH